MLLCTCRGLTHAQPQLTLDLANILSVYLDRNYTTTYANVVPVWQVCAGGGAGAARARRSVRLQRQLKPHRLRSAPLVQASSGNEFVLTMYIRVPPNQIIWYRCGARRQSPNELRAHQLRSLSSGRCCGGCMICAQAAGH